MEGFILGLELLLYVVTPPENIAVPRPHVWCHCCPPLSGGRGVSPPPAVRNP